MGLAAALLWATGFVVERPDLRAISASSLAAPAYLGAVASVAGFLAYFELLRRVGPVPLSLVFVLFPVMTAALARAPSADSPIGGRDGK
jgi:drug/metabolite transporter (DMT)-like permease